MITAATAVSTVGDVLTSLGTTPGLVPLAVPSVFLAPPGTDPDAQATHVIVKALQRGLNRLGARLAVDGRLGPDTAAALERVSAGSYAQKTWLNLLHDVRNAILQGKIVGVTVRPAARAAMGDAALGAMVPVLAVGGALVWLLLSGAKARA